MVKKRNVSDTKNIRMHKASQSKKCADKTEREIKGMKEYCDVEENPNLFYKYIKSEKKPRKYKGL